MRSENRTRSTARALPEGTAVASAEAMTRESSLRISSLRSPAALAGSLERRELLQTSSASRGERWAGERLSGFMSTSVASLPRLVNCQAASQPASPPPTMMIGFIQGIGSLNPQPSFGHAFVRPAFRLYFSTRNFEPHSGQASAIGRSQVAYWQWG